MSVRIYQLSKEIGMENADLISLLKERGHEVKSASSTVDNISAESLREEFASRVASETPPDPVAEPEPAPAKPSPQLPSGVIVRSKEDIERERREREEEETRKAEAYSNRNVREEPTGKSPPPLPRIPAMQPPPRTAAPQVPVPPTRVAPPKAPVLRSDLPPPPPPAPPPVSPSVPKPSPVVPPQPQTPAAVQGIRVPEVPKPASPQPVRPPLSKAPPALGVPPKASPQVAAPKPPPLPSLKRPASAAPEEATPGDGDETDTGDEVIPGKPVQPGLRPLVVRTPIVVRDFAIMVGRKPFQLISELMEMSIFASMNSAIEPEVAEQVARNHGFELEVRHRGGAAQAEVVVPVEEKKSEDDPALQEPRPPVVCILGHVDHGKTTLLDTIRKTNVVAGEAGGITQHVGAYQVDHGGKLITFIDTPGHAAFSNMRARGAGTTDIAVLVVAADDGFMPQTDEALKHARTANVPVVVAINKIDAPGANIDKVMRQMQERSLAPEELGGETLSAKVSALKNRGIEDLLDVILLQAEVTEGITANPNGNVRGVVLEAQKEVGRGSTATVIVQQGILKPGMALVCGELYCRVRQLVDDKGKPMKAAPPGTPVKIVGWSGPPSSGDIFREVKNEREAKREAAENELQRKKLEAAEHVTEGAVSVDDLFAAIERKQKKIFRVLVKADVYGTAEALSMSLMAIKSDKIKLDVVDMGVGDITRNDVLMSSATDACIVGFNVGTENGIVGVAKHNNVRIIQHKIIYELIDQIKEAMTDLLEPEYRENKIGAAEVRAIFPLGKGKVAGCMVTEGRIHRDAIARLMRGGQLVHESKIGALKRFKDDANEVRAGYECGIQMAGTHAYEERDVIEVFEILKSKPDL